MENENIQQPLDLIMIQHGLSNADLVRASTEQLSFKMVNKGRRGRRLTLNIQEKILRALLKAKPDLKLNRRDLFHYDLNESTVEQIENALTLIREKKIKYPQFVDLLAQAGVTRYSVQVALNKVTFYGTSGEAHVQQGPAISQAAPGDYYEDAIRGAIADAQKEAIDHPTFLKRIYEAGIAAYEANLRSFKIEYKGTEQSYRENIFQLKEEPIEAVPVKEQEKVIQKKGVKTKKKKVQKSMTRKKRVDFRKRHFKRSKR